MTHDHGLIPVKYLGVEQGVALLLALDFHLGVFVRLGMFGDHAL